MSIVELQSITERCDIEYSEIVSYHVDRLARQARFTFDLPFPDWRKRKFWNQFGGLFPRLRKPEARLLTIELHNVTFRIDDFLQEFSNSHTGHLEIDNLDFIPLKTGRFQMEVTCEEKDLHLSGDLINAAETPKFLTRDDVGYEKGQPLLR